jgi:hypothetical protein
MLHEACYNLYDLIPPEKNEENEWANAVFSENLRPFGNDATKCETGKNIDYRLQVKLF